jgi:fatty acid desaturase
MRAVPNEILQRAYERRPIHLLKVPFFWGLIVACGYAGVWAANHTAYGVPVGIAAGFIIGSLVRGLGSIGHDAVHGCVSRNKLVAYLLGFWAWSATLMSYTLYRAYHLDHHRIVNMPHDVDRVQVSRFTSNPRMAVALRLAIYLGLYPIYWATQVTRYAAKLSLGLKVRMYLELAVIFGGLLSLYPLMGKVAFFSVIGTQTVVGAVFASITSMCEHFGIEFNSDHAYSSRTYATRSRLLDFLWSGTNFHNEHHKYAGIPYYNLRRFHFEALPYYSDDVKKNIHPDFWPMVFRLFKKAATVSLEEERELARRDREALGQGPLDAQAEAA